MINGYKTKEGNYILELVIPRSGKVVALLKIEHVKIYVTGMEREYWELTEHWLNQLSKTLEQRLNAENSSYYLCLL